MLHVRGCRPTVSVHMAYTYKDLKRDMSYYPDYCAHINVVNVMVTTANGN